MKNSFVLYTDYMEHIQLLDMEQRGALLTAIMSYASDGTVIEMDGMTAMAFSFIKSQLDRDSDKYLNIVEARREAGKKGGKAKQNKAKEANACFDKQTEANQADNDNDNVNDTVNVKNKYTCAFEQFWDAYPRKKEKARAYKCYLARLKDGFSEDELLLAVKRYADECRCNETEEKYIKLASTFIGPNTPFSDYLRGDYKPPKAHKKSNSFNNFQGRDYDMSDLERKLIQ